MEFFGLLIDFIAEFVVGFLVGFGAATVFFYKD